MSDRPVLIGRHRGPPGAPAIIPKKPYESAADKQQRLLAERGVVRCTLCPWTAEGPMAEVIPLQVAHREKHGRTLLPTHAQTQRTLASNRQRWENSAAKRRREAKKAQSQPCGCGCGELTKPGNRYLKGHYIPKSPKISAEARAAATRRRWASLTPEQRAAIGAKISAGKRAKTAAVAD